MLRVIGAMTMRLGSERLGEANGWNRTSVAVIGDLSLLDIPEWCARIPLSRALPAPKEKPRRDFSAKLLLPLGGEFLAALTGDIALELDLVGRDDLPGVGDRQLLVL